jgi:sulfur-oxidizing protein SoxX
VNSPASKAIIEYTWGKIWNSKAYNACSNMPRAGHMGIMTEAQIRHLVALLVDPKSAVNQ